MNLRPFVKINNPLPGSSKAIFAFFFLLHIFTSLAAKDKITYGFERLAIHDYFNARGSFFDAIKKQPVPAYYGLSIICTRNNNPFYNLDSARIYILTADTIRSHLTTDEESKIETRYQINKFRISALKDSISLLAYDDALNKNSIHIWNDFIDNYRWSVISDSATAKRNELAYSIAKRKNTSDGYKEFYTLYPNSFQSTEARKRFEDRLFREKTDGSSEQSYENFIINNPESPYRMQAEDSLFAVATKSKTPESYYKFAKKYPGNSNTPTAWMKLYQRYLELYSVQNLDDFFSRYPDFKYKKQVEEDFRLSSVILLPARKNNRFTFITEEGRQTIPNLYDDVDEFSEGLCAVSKNGKYGYISKSGKLEINFQFEEAEPFEDGHAQVKLNGKASVINREGVQIIPPVYSEAGLPHDDRILFLDSMKYGFTDGFGKPVIKAQFEVAYDFSGGLAIAGKEDELGVIDRNGKWVLPPLYSGISVESNGLIHVEKDDMSGLLTRLGDEILPVSYDEIGRFSSGLALVSKNDKLGYADAIGHLVIPMQYEFDGQSIGRSEFSNGFAVVKEKGRYALIDSTGYKVIPAQYDDIVFYQQGMPIAARKKNKWGFIDIENKTTIPFKYDLVNPFSDGVAVVKSGKFFGAIEEDGSIVIPPNWEFISSFKNAVAVVKREGSFGLLSKSATLQVECAYEKYQWVSDSVIRFERGGKFGYFNASKREWIWREDGL